MPREQSATDSSIERSFPIRDLGINTQFLVFRALAEQGLVRVNLLGEELEVGNREPSVKTRIEARNKGTKNKANRIMNAFYGHTDYRMLGLDDIFLHQGIDEIVNPALLPKHHFRLTLNGEPLITDSDRRQLIALDGQQQWEQANQFATYNSLLKRFSPEFFKYDYPKYRVTRLEFDRRRAERKIQEQGVAPFTPREYGLWIAKLCDQISAQIDTPIPKDQLPLTEHELMVGEGRLPLERLVDTRGIARYQITDYFVPHWEDEITGGSRAERYNRYRSSGSDRALSDVLFLPEHLLHKVLREKVGWVKPLLREADFPPEKRFYADLISSMVGHSTLYGALSNAWEGEPTYTLEYLQRPEARTLSEETRQALMARANRNVVIKVAYEFKNPLKSNSSKSFAGEVQQSKNQLKEIGAEPLTETQTEQVIAEQTDKAIGKVNRNIDLYKALYSYSEAHGFSGFPLAL